MSASALSYSFERPAGWYGPGERAWTTSEASLSARLVAAAVSATVYPAAVDPGTDGTWILVRRPESGHVDAALSFRVFHVESVVDELEMLERRGAASIPVGPVVTFHDVVGNEGWATPDRVAVERAVAAVFPDGSDLGFEFSLATPDPSSFGDVVDYLLGIVATIRVEARAA